MNAGFPGATYCTPGALVRLEYGTTNISTAKGRSIRCVTLDRRGTVSQTAYGAADDVSPGWWVRERHGEAVLAKFFLDRRIKEVWRCPLARFERLDSAAHRIYMAEQQVDQKPDGTVPGAGSRSSSSGSDRGRKRKPTRELRPTKELKRTTRSGESN